VATFWARQNPVNVAGRSTTVRRVRLRLVAIAFLILFAAEVVLYLHHRPDHSGPVAVSGYSFKLPGNPHVLELRQQDHGARARQAIRTARTLTPLPLPQPGDERGRCAVRDLRVGLTDATTVLYENCTLPRRLDRLARFLASLPERTS
jgi:hypothetical protein